MNNDSLKAENKKLRDKIVQYREKIEDLEHLTLCLGIAMFFLFSVVYVSQNMR